MPRVYVGVDSSKPWSQQEGESPDAFAVFRSYIGQGSGRSIERTKQIAKRKWPKRFTTGKSIDTLAAKTYGASGTWAMRAGAYDSWVLARQQQRSEAGTQGGLAHTLKGTVKFADALLISATRLLRELHKNKTQRIETRTIREGLRDVTTMLRLAMGQPVDISSVEITDLRARMLQQIERMNRVPKLPAPEDRPTAPAPAAPEAVH